MMRGKVYESHQKDKMFGEISENKGKEREENNKRQICTLYAWCMDDNKTAERKQDITETHWNGSEAEI